MANQEPTEKQRDKAILAILTQAVENGFTLCVWDEIETSLFDAREYLIHNGIELVTEYPLSGSTNSTIQL